MFKNLNYSSGLFNFDFCYFWNFGTPSLILNTISSIINKKLQCLQISKFLRFKMIWRSWFEKIIYGVKVWTLLKNGVKIIFICEKGKFDVIMSISLSLRSFESAEPSGIIVTYSSTRVDKRVASLPPLPPMTAKQIRFFDNFFRVTFDFLGLFSKNKIK